jgi:glycerophosphoryl diester phosphodiesterase
MPNYLAEGDGMFINLQVGEDIESRELTLISHRGGKGFGPENTLESLAAALDFGVEMIETDVRISMDGIPLIYHSPFLGFHLLGHMSMSEIKEKCPTIPTLEEYLALAGDRCFINLEIKRCRPELLTEIILMASSLRPPLVSSFDAAFLEEFGRTNSPAKIGLLSQYEIKPERVIKQAIGCGASTLLPVSYATDREFVSTAHDAGLRIITWTINSTSQLENMIAAGVDGVITDCYYDMKEFLESRTMKSKATVPLLEESPGNA